MWIKRISMMSKLKQLLIKINRRHFVRNSMIQQSYLLLRHREFLNCLRETRASNFYTEQAGMDGLRRICLPWSVWRAKQSWLSKQHQGMCLEAILISIGPLLLRCKARNRVRVKVSYSHLEMIRRISSSNTYKIKLK